MNFDIKRVDRDFKLQVQMGLVPGVTIVQRFGERESMGTTAAGEDITRLNDLSATPAAPGSHVQVPEPPDAGEQMSIISENAGDDGDPVGTGVRTLRIHYLDASGDEQTEDKTMNGTTAVDTTATNMRFINDLHALTVGSTGVADGNIRVMSKSDNTLVYSMIAAGGNQAMLPHYMVPNGKTLYLMEWHCEEAQGKRVAFRIRSTDKGGTLQDGVFCFKDTSYIFQTASGPLAVAAVVPALSIVKISGWPDLANAEGSCGWWGYLVTG